MPLQGDWRAEAKCAGVIEKFEVGPDEDDADLFYPPRSKEHYAPIAIKAKAMCRGRDLRPECPVRLHCLWAAISTDEEHGIWGGMSHRERNASMRKWKKKYPNREKSLHDYVMDGLE